MQKCRLTVFNATRGIIKKLYPAAYTGGSLDPRGGRDMLEQHVYRDSDGDSYGREEFRRLILAAVPPLLRDRLRREGEYSYEQRGLKMPAAHVAMMELYVSTNSMFLNKR